LCFCNEYGEKKYVTIFAVRDEEGNKDVGVYVIENYESVGKLSKEVCVDFEVLRSVIRMGNNGKDVCLEKKNKYDRDVKVDVSNNELKFVKRKKRIYV